MAKIPSVHIPAEIKNLAINGNFDYWQRVESATTTVNTTSTVTGYTADMFSYSSTGSTNKNYSIVQSSNVPTLTQSGFESTFSYLFTIVTGIASFAAGDYINPCWYKMEGYDFQRIFAKNVTFGFWVYATVAGTYSFALANNAATRSYVTTFTVSATNTWQYVSISVPMDTIGNVGSWTFSNAASLLVFIGVCSGTTVQTSSTGTWQSGFFLTATGATNWMATSGNVLQIAQFSITESNLGLGYTGFQRAGKTIQQELALCQRYYEKSYPQGTAIGTATRASGKFWTSSSAGGQEQMSVQFSVVKCAAPAGTIYSTDTANASGKRRNITSSADESASFTDIGTTSMCQGTNLTANSAYGCHWTADAGL